MATVWTRVPQGTDTRLNLGDLGIYAYGSSGHLHAPTSITSGSAAYTASYDPAGNMVCRAPTTATTCAGPNPTGAQLQYDAEERLAHWQNAPSNPTTASYLYDGAGERVAQSVTSGGTTTTTAYLGGNEEVATTGASTTTTTYYSVAGRLIALAVNGSFSYLAGDGLGSVSAAFDANGNPQASVLYRPYGTPRYTSGSMPGSYGFTEQRNDTAITGLDYDHARSYDPAAGTFTTADNLLLDAKAVQRGQARMLLNRYAYVGGDPETRTDPTGHRPCGDDGEGCGTHAEDSALGTFSGYSHILDRIYRTFHDYRTRAILIVLMYSATGRQFLDFLLQAGAVMGGDAYIQWDSGPPSEGLGGGYTKQDGTIVLSTSLLAPFSDPHTQTTDSNPADIIIRAAAGLVHEAVESYYVLADGIATQASQHMDYVAQWYAGKTEFELNAALGGRDDTSEAYMHSFDAWITTGDGTAYASQPRDQWEVTTPSGRAAAHAIHNADTLQLNNPPDQWSDAMGLSPSTLTAGCVEPDQCYV